jgi:hypothetical protein
MSDETPTRQLASFLAKFEPDVAASARAALAQLRKKLPGAKLPDPAKVLKGGGTRARHIVLTDLKILEQPAVKKLMALALKSAKKPLDSKQRGRLIIKSISAQQRPRRPSPP